MCIAFDLGGGSGEPIYWRNWATPFSTYLFPGALGRFTGFWSVLSNALFAYIGTSHPPDPPSFANNLFLSYSPKPLLSYSLSYLSYSLTTFLCVGTELIGVTIGEVANPRKAVPKAIKSTFFRSLSPSPVCEVS